MAIQAVFQRNESKYLMDIHQYHEVLQAMEKYMEPDAYPLTHIRNIYYDTPEAISSSEIFSHRDRDDSCDAASPTTTFTLEDISCSSGSAMGQPGGDMGAMGGQRPGGSMGRGPQSGSNTGGIAP